MTNKELVDMGQNGIEKGLLCIEREVQPVFHHQLAAEVAQRQEDLPTADAQ